MKFETRTEEDGKVVLQLGLSHEVSFPAELDIDAVVTGIDVLMKGIFSVGPAELAQAVLREYEKNGQEMPKFVDFQTDTIQ